MLTTTLSSCLWEDLDSTALIAPQQPAPFVFSHRELRRQVLNFQRKLATLGISHNDSVAIALPNSAEFIISFLAISLQRAICAPLNSAYKQDEFQYYLNDLSASLLLVPKGSIDEDTAAVKAARARNTPVAEVDFDWMELAIEKIEMRGLARRIQAPLNQPTPEDVALILHTSGTTGRPKAVPLSHRNLCRTMLNIQNTYELTASDRTLLVMPLFHVHGLLAGFLAPLLSKGSVIVPARFSASEFWKDFVQYKANSYTAVPTMHQILLKNELPDPMPKIRFVRSCSSPLAPVVHQQLEQLMNAPVLEAYAMTEASHQMTSNPLPPAHRKPGSVGTPQGVDLQIMDDAGLPLARRQIGEVCVKGENVTHGYLDVAPEVAASAFTKSGYFRTGDQGYLDQDGYLFLTGRIKELINKGGEKISPIEIDNMVSQHPLVHEAVSFAIDDELYGENVAVAVVLKEGANLAATELAAWCGQRAAKFKVPKKIYYTETMPKTATGKVQRRLVAKAMIEREANAIEMGHPITKVQPMHFASDSGSEQIRKEEPVQPAQQQAPFMAWLSKVFGGCLKH